MTQDISKMETTAVEWFFDNLKNHEIQAEHFKLYKHALAMEKEQIIRARWIGDYSCDSIKAEQYYNETYGGKDL